MTKQLLTMGLYCKFLLTLLPSYLWGRESLTVKALHRGLRGGPQSGAFHGVLS